MPSTEHGKAIASRNATTHGLFARDIVLPALGEDPQGYQQIQAQWIAQLAPANLLEHHYVEKIAAASWRLRRLHRWQAQLFEDETLTEDARLDRLDKVLRHETALHRQIDTAVKMLGKDVPQLYTRRVRDGVMLDLMVSERECRESAREETEVDLETRGRLRRIRKATEAAVGVLSQAPLDTEPLDTVGANLVFAPATSALFENCRNEPSPQPVAANEVNEEGYEEYEVADEEEADAGVWKTAGTQNCQNEPGRSTGEDRRAFLDSFPRATAVGAARPDSGDNRPARAMA